MWASSSNHNCCALLSGLPKTVNPTKKVTATIKHQLTCRSSCMRSFIAAEIPPFPCRPPRLLDGRGDDGAGTETDAMEWDLPGRGCAIIGDFFSLPLQTLGWWDHFWQSRVTRTKGEARPSAVNPFHTDNFLFNQVGFFLFVFSKSCSQAPSLLLR